MLVGASMREGQKGKCKAESCACMLVIGLVRVDRGSRDQNVASCFMYLGEEISAPFLDNPCFESIPGKDPGSLED